MKHYLKLKSIKNGLELVFIWGLCSENLKIKDWLIDLRLGIIEKGVKLGVKIINDVSGLEYDSEPINILKKYKIPLSQIGRASCRERV